jgi:hypothetical protein
VIRVAEELDRSRRVAGALPDDKCRLGLLDEQADVVVVASRERVQERPFGFPPFR